MAGLTQRVQTALDEARILVLGTQVLLGFQYRAFMEPAFDRLPAHVRNCEMAGLALLLAALGFLLAPAARHRIVERGWDSTPLIRFTMNCMFLALLPFTAALAFDLYGAAEQIGGASLGFGAGIGAALCMGLLWYAVPWFAKRTRPHHLEEDEMSQPSLDRRIQQVLTEARVVLPGAQALLGFQLAMVLMDAFDKLSPAARQVHFISLCFIALTTALLMAPPAFHRIAEGGLETERMERFTSGMILAALVSLAAGLSLEVAVVFQRWSGSLGLGWSAVTFCALIAGWFGTAFWLRRKQ